ncbi:hypothetical protein A3C91_04755 [Candidatus Azambacteria bacterium RIFCSPHIGHO2_02_FULL_52_12]|uniref:Uncharacterized protein n=1 Tax=Candidatus Azambacteria bacterium RIFCSPLOWO2_01_FULL_46_25 TaxID=1797298 RepID=A0A1F5BUT0_9BACT|nr:MAG: hypothetical protein A3C91_04755 [Candidatus Azambacteria bacterium RIFCSPHIGHO2_02_FULL_52_12]OGD34379.1 MAG: hypothetical protein A2988_02525 [Candidatus Azambacteria bacterium RIFCSPLOWO2_01_FULL_46_25]OGD37343.1 MAG: hypothetical protein A2850_01360 [Candidatus Azambacteria bacterium RIFCSPHIGHO2_01_FULL_51_74]
MNTEQIVKEKKQITLKEAAEISGYAPDYIGQLIRKGKIPGEQIYASVAWVTTEAAMRAYLLETRLRKERGEAIGGFLRRCAHWLARAGMAFGFAGIARALLWLIIIIVLCFALILFSIFSVSLEKRIERQNLERALHKSAELNIPLSH